MPKPTVIEICELPVHPIDSMPESVLSKFGSIDCDGKEAVMKRGIPVADSFVPESSVLVGLECPLQILKHPHNARVAVA